MALITTISGPYVGVVGSGIPLGMTQSGFTLSWAIHGHRVNKTNSWGKTLIEGVFMGADWSISAVFREANSVGLLATMYPWGRNAAANPRTLPYMLGNMGRRWTSFAVPLTLASFAGTPAAASPATLTATQAIVPDGAYRLNFDSSSRDIPVQYVLLPDSSSGLAGEELWFTTT